MGASVWQREGAAGGGKTFTSGVVASAPRNAPRPGKRKLIWKRDEHQVLPCVRFLLMHTPFLRPVQGQGVNCYSSYMQGGGDAAQPEPDASKDVENNSKKPRTGSASESCAQPPAPSNGAGGLRQKPSQMHAASVQHGSASNGLSRPTGAAQYQHAAAGPGKAPSGQNGQAPAAGTAGRQQSSAQSPVEELRQLKEKIAARQAQLQREQVMQQDWPTSSTCSFLHSIDCKLQDSHTGTLNSIIVLSQICLNRDGNPDLVTSHQALPCVCDQAHADGPCVTHAGSCQGSGRG